jgi:hypothetical protein
MLSFVWRWSNAVMNHWFAWVGLASTISWLVPAVNSAFIGRYVIVGGLSLLFLATFAAWKDEAQKLDTLSNDAQVAIADSPTIEGYGDVLSVKGELFSRQMLLKTHLRNFGQITADDVSVTAIVTYHGDTTAWPSREAIVGTLHPNQEHDTIVKVHLLSPINEPPQLVPFACKYQVAYRSGNKRYTQDHIGTLDSGIKKVILTNHARVEVRKHKPPLQVQLARVWQLLKTMNSE